MEGGQGDCSNCEFDQDEIAEEGKTFERRKNA